MSEPSPRVAIFDPAPIFTVTIEGGAARAPEVHFHPGGQGWWVARMVQVLGGEPVLCGAFGGEPGALLLALAERRSVLVRAADCSGSNGGYVHDRRSGERTDVVDIPPPDLHRHEVDDLYNLLLEEASRSQVVVLTGMRSPSVVPLDVYRRLLADLEAFGCLVVADLDVHNLLAATGTICCVKVSHVDLIAAGEATGNDAGELILAARRCQQRGAANVVVSRADEPALALFDEAVFEILVPRIEPADTRGGGDSITGALAFGVGVGLKAPQLLALVGAAGAVNVTRHGLGSGLASTIEALAERVELRRLSR